MAKAKVDIIYKSSRITVEPTKILASRINPQPEIRKAVQVDENTVMKVRSVSTPKPRADAPEKIMQVFKEYQDGAALREHLQPLVTGEDEEELGALKLKELRQRVIDGYGYDPSDIPKKKPAVIQLLIELKKNKNLLTIAMFVSETMRQIPLEGYSRAYVGEDGEIVDSKDVKNFQVEGVKDGVEQLKPFPKVVKTRELVIGDDNVYPRIYEGNMLQAKDYLYEMPAVGDVNRFAAAELHAALSDWTKADGTKLGEVMAVIQPYYLIGGTTQEYIAIITSLRIVEEDGTEKFTILMRLCQSNMAYSEAMALPLPGETPKTIEANQAPLRTVGFAQLVQAMQAAK